MRISLSLLLALAVLQAAHGANPGTQGNYLVLTAKENQAAPFGSVRITYGPVQQGQSIQLQWWEMELRATPDFESTPLFVLRALTAGNPLAGTTNQLSFERYILQIPETGESLDFRDKHTGHALLPGWANFEQQFLPRRAMGSRLQSGMPETCLLLGHVLTLHHTHTNAAWKEWPAPTQLNLDRELLVGTSRPFRDSEGHRLPQQPQRQNYTYVPFTGEDYRLMIDAGVNLFTVNPEQEKRVRAEPVFYIRTPGGKSPIKYPADLYRANYLGPTMFMDEPSILMVGDTNVHRTLKYFSDAAALIEKRTRAVYDGSGSYGSWALEKALLSRGINLGDMRVQQVDIPSWETLYDTTYYQMRGGGAGIVHEGRYQLPGFDKGIASFTGKPRQHTPEEILRYYYAFLRGGTRPFGKFWGTAIYGQCDTNIAPLALTLAYDMGARYLWFWTSDHEHHVPWPEQMALIRHLNAHVKAHPRPSIYKAPPPVDVAIVIPYGYFLSWENLWWVRELDKAGENESSKRYRRLMQRALAAVHECFDKGLSFDITVDDGRAPVGYQKIIRVSGEE